MEILAVQVGQCQSSFATVIAQQTQTHEADKKTAQQEHDAKQQLAK